MKRKSRRQFLSTTSAVGVAAVLSASARPDRALVNDQTAVALIGFNGMGYHLQRNGISSRGASCFE